MRDLLRQRSQLVRQRTTNLLSIQNLLTRNTGQALSGNRLKQLSAEEVEQLLPQAELALAVKSNLAVLQCLEGQIEQIEAVVLARVKLRTGNCQEINCSESMGRDGVIPFPLELIFLQLHLG